MTGSLARDKNTRKAHLELYSLTVAAASYRHKASLVRVCNAHFEM